MKILLTLLPLLLLSCASKPQASGSFTTIQCDMVCKGEQCYQKCTGLQTTQ
ncbi:hypothetical protein [Helicobacter sp. 12S02634-8]|uniref:hypothetical protein n=1 Tax=Helicobacter sp. 12S02634-8 TaxID=1476199 RepID=UPI00155390F8|nr:hypothetical protein [Helicobacter sp. 12S02634-8]